MKIILVTPGCNCITDDYDRVTLLPGWVWGDSWVLFKLKNNVIKEMYTGDLSIGWHQIDTTKVDYLLMEFMLQHGRPEKFNYTKEVLDYALTHNYINQKYYDHWVTQ